MLRQQDFPLPSEYDVAYAAADELIFEIDPNSMQDPALAMRLMQAATYTDGRTLKSVLSEEAYSKLAEQAEKSNLSIEMLNGFKPGMVAMMITMQELSKHGVSQEGVDVFYARKAKKDGKAIGELETIDFQMQILAEMGEGYESEFILYGLKDIEQINQKLDELLSFWRQGDLDGVEKLMLAEMKEFPDVYKDLLLDRNNHWLPKIEQMLTSQQVEFVLFGVAHAVGDDGLLALLKEKGYQVEQIKASD